MVELSELSDHDRLILGLRFRLKHIRLALSEIEEGRVPDGFEFSPADTKETMLAELRRLQIETQKMLMDNGADGSGLLN